MNSNPLNRMILAALLCTLSVSLSPSAHAQGQSNGATASQDQGNPDQKKTRKQLEEKRQQAAEARRANREQGAAPPQQTLPPQANQPPPAVEGKQNAAENQRAARERVAANPPAPPARSQDRPQANKARQDQHLADVRAMQADKAQQHAQAKEVRQEARLSQQQQQAFIRQQQQRATAYSQSLAQQQIVTQRGITLLQQQKRMSQYRYQQQYYDRMRQQQLSFQGNNYNYINDPYFYTASSYRYNRGGRYYETNQYGANMLRQAANYGYQEGFQAGLADRQDHWRYDYRQSYAYRDANYGYNGYYVQQGDYNYYFRQGFRRGYEDGYYSRHRYGHYSNGSGSMLGTVLLTVLVLEAIHH